MTNPDLTEGLGELEIKPETLRYVVRAASDLRQDASFNVEQWVLTKVSDAFRRSISNAIIHGSGIGMPIGILNPNAGIPICDTARTAVNSRSKTSRCCAWKCRCNGRRTALIS
jgi:HK97 family phage major capsid protein